MNINQLIMPALNKNNIILASEAQLLLVRYLELLQTWNRVFNLTTITQPAEMVYLHLIDSLVVLPYLHGTHCLDVGSGAGLPGIPLAIAQPERQWVLLDKNSKKTRFLTQVVAELGLKNITVVHARCENFQAAEGFTSILSRAFGSIRLLVETTEHLLSSGGHWIAMKGQYPTAELSELPSRFVVQRNEKVLVKGRDMERHIIVVTK